MGRDRRPARVALALAALGMLGGCALLQPEADPAAARATPELPPPVTLVVEAPAPLKALLEAHLDLARLRSVAPAEQITDQELRRLEAAAPAQARALLETEGYFEAEVTLQRTPGTPPQVQVRVRPGPRTRVGSVDLDWRGGFGQAIERGDARALGLARTIERAWPLEPGSAFRNPDWSAAKTGVLARVRAGGYAAATLHDSRAQVDVEAARAELALTVDSGPLFRIGRLDIRGLDRQSPTTVRNLADISIGQVASEETLLDFQERLQRANLYQNASVALDTDPAQADAAVVQVRLREQPLQQATVGLGYSENAGARVSLEHLHRMPFGQRATWRNKIEFGQRRQAWEGELASQTQPRLYRNLLGYTAERVESDVDTVLAAQLRLGRVQERRDVQRLGFVQFERAEVRRSTGDERADALSFNLHGVWLDVDNLLLPTDGVSLALQAGVGVARSNDGDGGPFTRLYGRLYYWKPIGNWYAQARLELGQVFLKSDVVIPDTQRFRAGGDDSVRGYAFRTLGPEVAGQVTSGNVLMTASVEVARPLLERMPALWGAAFVDVGQAADHWGDLKPVWGAGVGVRLRSPVGPLRLDLAYGEAVQRWRMHLSVGIALQGP